VQIEFTVGLIQRDGAPHDGAAGTVCHLDAVDAGCHIGKMTEVSGNSQRQSVSLRIHLPNPHLIRAGCEIRGQISLSTCMMKKLNREPRERTRKEDEEF
jgi:hypothetical protein